MNNTALLTAVCILFTAVGANSKPNQAFDEQLEGYPKNMARHHMGTNLFAFDTEKMSFEPTAAASAWLDDDVSTGWAPMSGKNYYLLALPEANLLTNFMISAKASVGKVNLYAGDELALPNSGSWFPVVRNLSISDINGKKISKPFSRFAKYLLIETDLSESGIWYSLYAYGDHAAVRYSLEKRDNELEATAVFGPHCNEQTAISLSSLYTGARIVNADAATDRVSWQKAIDDDPESSVSVEVSKNNPGIVLKFGSPVNIQRISLLTSGEVKGRFDFYLLEALDRKQHVASNTESEYLQVANTLGNSLPSPREIELTELSPTATVILDGTTSRSSINFPPTKTAYLLAQWTADDGSSAAELSELNAFDPSSLNTDEIKADDSADDELSEDEGDSSKDGKTFVDFKGGKKALLPAVGEFLPSRVPFVPGALGAPVILTNFEEPTSP